jgi:hypothetical protein
MFLLLSLLLAQTPAAAEGQTLAAADASKLTLGTPATLVVVETDKIKGEPWELAWSPDGEQLHLVAMKRVRDGSMELTFHLIDTKSGKVEKVDAKPEWAADYWNWKSHRAAPGKPSFEIGLDQQQKNESNTARPMGGDLARGGASSAQGASVDAVAGQMSTNILIITLLLKGEVIGQWKGEPFVPGMTYGWAPAGMNAMAFAAQDGRLMLLDEQGRKQKIERTKDVRLPAWTTDGRRLAWIERQDKKKFRIQVAEID